MRRLRLVFNSLWARTARPELLTPPAAAADEWLLWTKRKRNAPFKGAGSAKPAPKDRQKPGSARGEAEHKGAEGEHPEQGESEHGEGSDKKVLDEDYSKKPFGKQSRKWHNDDDFSHSDSTGDPKKDAEYNRDRWLRRILAGMVGAAFAAVYIKDLAEETQIRKMSYKEFLDKLAKHEVRSLEIVTDYKQVQKQHKVLVRVGRPHGEAAARPRSEVERMKSKEPTIAPHQERLWELDVLDPTDFLANLEREMKGFRYQTHEFVPVKFVNGYSTRDVFFKVLRDSLIIAFSVYILYTMKDMKAIIEKMMPSSSRAIKTFEVKKLKGGFETVAGLETPKMEIQEFVDFLKDPFIYASVGARMPKGALLTGPPGTGKTLLAKACAVESKVSFFAVSGSDFVEKYVGIGSQNVRKLFQEAKMRAPSVIFIDEIDAIGKKRHEAAMFTNTERENTLNQLLVELDGFDSKTSVVVLAATNRPEILDPALLRPGRLDRHIALTLPDIRAREEIFRLYLSKLKIDEGKLDYLTKRLASLSPQFSGADISNLCNEAAILAAREYADTIELKHFEEAAERVIGGLRRDSLVSKEERRLVATHESGHAVASWFLKGADPLVKVTIVPRSKGALGYAQYLTEDDDIFTKSGLMDKITFIFGGRVAEELFFGKISTGAQDDLEKAFKIAHTIVTRLGMTEEFAYANFEGDEKRNQFSPTKENVKFSDATQEKIDAQITKIIEECYARCRAILTEKRHLVEKLRDTLLEKESVTLADLNEILGERPVHDAPQFGFRLNGAGRGN